MCGLAGFIDTQARNDLAAVARAMNDAIRHRGPDSFGEWTDPALGVALGHRRLSILDLSPAGHQPMVSAGERWVMVFNGEIYNHLELRDALAAQGASPDWRGHSDTETMLACFEAWGVEASLRRFAGMFAFAALDRASRSLWLARDRYGEKPLYYGWQRGSLIFGSELKALRRHPDFIGTVNREALARLLRYSYVPAPLAIYDGIWKLPPGSCLQLRLDGLKPSGLPEPTAYWSAASLMEAGIENPRRQTPAEAIDELDTILRKVVADQMVADVPLGAMLSGGVDSSTVVGLMQAMSPRPVHTFSIGFEEKDFNEAEFAKAVSKHLGTSHTELYLRPKDALDLVPQLPTLFDEPVGDYSTIPSYLVAKLARTEVKVALSGDGGDELFGGYTRYFLTIRLWRSMGWMPLALRRAAAGLLRSLAPLAAMINGVVPRAEDRTRRIADVLALDDFDALYDNLRSHWRPPVSGVQGVGSGAPLLALPAPLRAKLSHLQTMLLNDQLHHLPDHVLGRIDAAAMAVGLEGRAPLLDPRVAEFALRQPDEHLYRDGQSKWILRQVLFRYVPRELIERPKMGFSVPISAWIRGPMREWAEDLLSESRLRADGLFDVQAVRDKWIAHRDGKRDFAQLLWNVLVVQQWLDAARRP